MPCALVNCNTYQKEQVRTALDALLADLGGLEKYVPDGASVLIKANLIGAFPPEKAATTHPAVVEALCEKLISECNARVTVGDSPGGLYNSQFLSRVYKVTGMTGACESSGAKLNFDFGSAEFDNPDGIVLKTIQCIDAFLKADVVINLAKFKTHALTGFTGCVKNLFGLMPGLAKVGLHSRFEDLGTFCDCLLDIERFAAEKVALHLIDGVVGMHKDGPSNGEPIALGKLIGADNAHHADCVAISVFGNPLNISTVVKAVERGILQPDLSDVPCDLSKIEANTEFIAVSTASLKPFFKMKWFIKARWIQKLLRNLTTKKVKIVESKCRGCSKCVEHCPKTAMKLGGDKKVKIKQKSCIRCYCCQELCPFGAVEFKKPFFNYGKKRRNSKKRQEK